MLIEDLVSAHFDFVFPRLVARVRESERFAETLTWIWFSGLGPRRTGRLKRLVQEAERRAEAMRRRERRRRRALRATR